MDSRSVLSQGPQARVKLGPKKAKVGIPFAALKCIIEVSTPTNAEALEFKSATSSRRKFPANIIAFCVIKVLMCFIFCNSFCAGAALKTQGIL